MNICISSRMLRIFASGLVCMIIFSLVPVAPANAKDYAATFDCRGLNKAWSSPKPIAVRTDVLVKFTPGRTGRHKIKFIVPLSSGAVPFLTTAFDYYPSWYSGSNYGGTWGPYHSGGSRDVEITLKTGDSSIWYEVQAKMNSSWNAGGYQDVRVYCD